MAEGAYGPPPAYESVADLPSYDNVAGKNRVSPRHRPGVYVTGFDSISPPSEEGTQRQTTNISTANSTVTHDESVVICPRRHIAISIIVFAISLIVMLLIGRQVGITNAKSSHVSTPCGCQREAGRQTKY